MQHKMIANQLIDRLIVLLDDYKSIDWLIDRTVKWLQINRLIDWLYSKMIKHS